MKTTKLTFFISLLLFISCQPRDSHLSNEFKRITELADTNAYAAGLLVDSIKVNETKLSAENAMRLKLLDIKVADKKDLLKPAENLNAIDSIINFFNNREGDDETLAEAYYYKGRILSDMLYYKDATEQFKLTLNLLDKSKRYFLRANASSQLSYIYQSMYQTSESLNEELAVWRSALKTGNQNFIKQSELQLLSLYIVSDSLQKAEYHLNKLNRDIIDNDSSILTIKIKLQEAHLRIKQKRYRESDSILNLISDKAEIFDKKAYDFIAALLYSKTGDKKRAKIFYKRLLAQGEHQDSRLAFDSLLSMGAAERDWKMIDDVVAAIPRVDSLEKAAFVYTAGNSHIDNVEYIMDKNRDLTVKVRNYGRKNTTLLFSLCAAVAIIILLIFFIRRERRIKNQIPEMTENGNTVNKNQVGRPKKKDYDIKIEKVPVPEGDVRYFNLETFDAISKVNLKAINAEQWENIENEIKEKEPVFYKKFQSYSLNDIEWKVTVLIKGGFKQTDVSTIIGRSRSSVSKIMKTVCERIVDTTEPTASLWDEFVSRS